MPAAPAVPPTPAPAPASTAPALAEQWVAEVWIDPDWYAEQQSTDPLPSPGLPVVVALRHTSVLIGRASRSRGIAPDLDLGTDTGISRRHAQLTTDGTRWFVEDLGSSNGTYVGGALGVLPTTPVTVGAKVEVRPDERVYVGAWTRIVVRRAAPGEI
ncbi:FHA domain-containing protein [Nocardioides dongxiaopingii]|uniref:FHA domain-containing protein n=1 Tax=Nocardioides sp. S-1144 TaxID=2582905 RepID=UPI0021CB0FF8|nr:FHA domain-containing protein [Nocardioides sp. S-1144]